MSMKAGILIINGTGKESSPAPIRQEIILKQSMKANGPTTSSPAQSRKPYTIQTKMSLSIRAGSLKTAGTVKQSSPSAIKPEISTREKWKAIIRTEQRSVHSISPTITKTGKSNNTISNTDNHNTAAVGLSLSVLPFISKLSARKRLAKISILLSILVSTHRR